MDYEQDNQLAWQCHQAGLAEYRPCGKYNLILAILNFLTLIKQNNVHVLCEALCIEVEGLTLCCDLACQQRPFDLQAL